MSPILTRPVREQFEHDRIIRLLQARYRRKFEVAINPAAEQNDSVTIAEQVVFPDLVLYGQGVRQLQGTVEVETGESVNTLEAMAQWGLFSRLPVPFSLYVPPQALDTARRLCVEHNITVAEIWTYHTALDQVRFTMVHRTDAPVAPAEPLPSAKTKPVAPAPGTKPKTAAPTPGAKPKTAAPALGAKPKTAVPVDEKPAAKPAAAKTAKPVAKPAAKPAAKAVKPVVKPAARPASKAAKPAPKAKVAAKPVAKPAAKAKPTPKKSVKPAVKSAAARKTARPAKRR